MIPLHAEFYECEHQGDLDNYIADIVKCGGKIGGTSLDHEDEIGYVSFSVDDEKDFNERFRKTESHDFLN